MKQRLIMAWRNNKGLLLFFVLMLIFRSAVADWSDVPTGSMKPTILEGDRIFVNKLAYDIRLPFTHISLYKLDDPTRGEIIIFDSEVSNKRLVKRVIGVPGDRIAMENNQLVINGKVLNYTSSAKTENARDFLEALPNKQHKIRVSQSISSLASFSSVVVPQGHYLVLGDNRDNSADSRVIGFVPRNEIVGSSRFIVLSLDYNNYFLPRKDRFFQEML